MLPVGTTLRDCTGSAHIVFMGVVMNEKEDDLMLHVCVVMC